MVQNKGLNRIQILLPPYMYITVTVAYWQEYRVHFIICVCSLVGVTHDRGNTCYIFVHILDVCL